VSLQIQQAAGSQFISSFFFQDKNTFLLREAGLLWIRGSELLSRAKIVLCIRRQIGAGTDINPKDF
jgi:hypothetical protein